MYAWRPLVALVTISALFHVNGVRAQDDDTDPFPAAGISTDPVEIVFSFDTTGSMYPVIGQVRNVVAGMIHRLQSDIPGIRMAVFAHGDYTDNYVTKYVDFSTDSAKLQRFVNSVGRTGGGDSPEAYEMVLREAWSELSWSVGSQRSLVMIGDERPHESDYQHNKLQIDWRSEAEQLNAMGVRIYAIQALHAIRADTFYKTIANITGGYHLRLDNFDSIFDFILAISYREFGLIFLEAYEEEVRSRPGGITPELAKLFETLKKPRKKKKVPTATLR